MRTQGLFQAFVNVSGDWLNSLWRQTPVYLKVSQQTALSNT